ncbi:putative aldouronate transport system substrate-binding protein [Paenibacillus sp. UNCCL117]|uniref:extracellular solute-binding protein n=1 Tax=unclassified Paenibacillus TaxID=185978 RepID=UPI000882F270|nr:MULTISPECIES: extracellular solute-binding protein [unclassified Paenibacillus]SDC07713.1 putative aldouronate transport system substrate-binding protein [Paenibacillus sp. cl123]SFW38110.1 putative aldouronate transport system substrate-binding protein [Paenibacillus sp. UNCCL117]
MFKKMRRNKAGAVSAILALALMAAGCSGTGGKPADTAEAGDKGAKTEEKRGSITVSLYDRGTVPAEEGTMDNNRWTKWVNEKGPADVKYMTVPRFESLQKYNVMFASGSAPDLIFEFDTAYHGQLYSQKQLMPLDDLIAKHSTTYKAMLEQYPALKKAGTMPDGKLYTVGRPMQLAPQHYLFVRADWLKKLNLKTPTTPEELLEVVKAFTLNDPDGNGKADTQGIGLSFVSGIILNNMFGTGFTLFGTDQYPWYVKDGKVVHDWERLKAALDYQKQIYEGGYADKDFVTDKNGEKQKQAWITGKLGIYGGNGADVNTYAALKKNVPDAEVIPIALPKTEFGQFSPTLSNPIQMTGMVNAAAKDPVSVIKMIDFMASETFTHTIEYGIEGQHWKVSANGCPEPIDAEKNKKERDYNRDMNMLFPLLGKCYGLANKPNPSATDKEMIEIINQAKTAYMDQSRPMVGITQKAYLPILPQDLAQINNNSNKTILDLALKAIVSGKSYTVDQFLQEAKAAWEKAGGAKVDEFYDKWYQENKGTAILMDDIYKMK